MQPTYNVGTTVYYDPTQVHPQVGQAVLFYLPAGAEEGECASAEIGGRACAVAVPGLTHTISMGRVAGLAGETVAVRDGHLVRNGQPLSEASVPSCGASDPNKEPGCEYPTPITVPANSYYVIADNRPFFQADSRAFGAVTQLAIVGTVLGG